jgi:hypothetical protein
VNRFPGTLRGRWLAKSAEVKQLIALLVLTDFGRRAVVWRKLIRCQDADR